MQLSIAGDFTAIIVDKQKEIDMPSDKGLLLGLTEETSYETYESKILSGNSYFFLSDGCLEARNLQGNSINLTKILTIVASNQNNDELLNNLTKLYESFSSQYLEDDITIANLFINNL
jgi:serine phosphatase RsbU (regulator of sigma subunit)